jgi:hypothetical protein
MALTALTAGQLAMLIEGLDWSRVTPLKVNVPIRAVDGFYN